MTATLEQLTACATAERKACADYVRARAKAASMLLAQHKCSAETADHVGRVVALVADELEQGFHDGR